MTVLELELVLCYGGAVREHRSSAKPQRALAELFVPTDEQPLARHMPPTPNRAQALAAEVTANFGKRLAPLGERCRTCLCRATASARRQGLCMQQRRRGITHCRLFWRQIIAWPAHCLPPPQACLCVS